MSETTREKLLKIALVAFGAIFLLVYPLGLIWPSGWVWGMVRKAAVRRFGWA
jgi:hypothetical protein